MVLCQDLMYNTPCTYATNYLTAYTVSLSAVQLLIETYDLTSKIFLEFVTIIAYEYSANYSWDMATSNPATYRIMKKILDECTVSINGSEFLTLEEALEGVEDVVLVLALASLEFHFPRVGISREDFANISCELVTTTDDGSVNTHDSYWVIIYSLLTVAGYLTPAEACIYLVAYPSDLLSSDDSY